MWLGASWDQGSTLIGHDAKTVTPDHHLRQPTVVASAVGLPISQSADLVPSAPPKLTHNLDQTGPWN